MQPFRAGAQGQKRSVGHSPISVGPFFSTWIINSEYIQLIYPLSLFGITVKVGQYWAEYDNLLL